MIVWEMNSVVERESVRRVGAAQAEDDLHGRTARAETHLGDLLGHCSASSCSTTDRSSVTALNAFDWMDDCRDLKTANVMMNDEDAAVLIDLGSAVEMPQAVTNAAERQAAIDDAAELIAISLIQGC
jgi:hypothetical protein